MSTPENSELANALELLGLDPKIDISSLSVADVEKQFFKMSRKRRKIDTEDSGGSVGESSSKSNVDRLSEAKTLLLTHLQNANDGQRLEPTALAWFSSPNDKDSSSPWLYVGPYAAAQDLETLRKHKISHIVCVAAEGYPRLFENSSEIDVKYLERPIVETECTRENGASLVADVLDDVVEFVREALRSASSSKSASDTCRPKSGCRILVHCLHGKTRSAAVAAVLKAVVEKTSFEEAFVEMKLHREVMIPDEWFSVFEKEVGRLEGALEIVPTVAK